jgi:TRAP-type C4-dicarboxylate transport system substrate-binding protein
VDSTGNHVRSSVSRTGPLFLETFKAFGANPTPINFAAL